MAKSTEGEPKNHLPSEGFSKNELDPIQLAAIHRAIAWGEELAEHHPEVAELYRTTELSYWEIAQSILPPEALAISAQVATKAVGYAVRSLIPEEEQREITKRRRAAALLQKSGGLGTQAHRDHQIAANRRRHQLHGVDVGAMIRGRGRTPWTEDERNSVMALTRDPQFQHKKGAPNYQAITFAINELFHQGDEVRYPNSVGSLVRDVRRAKKRAP